MPITIIVHRTEDNYGKGTISYDKTLRWSVSKGQWETGLICKDLDGNPDYQFFSNRLTRLIKKDEKYVIQENCQKGGPGFFELKRITSELSDFYKIVTDEDDVGYYAALHIQREDSLSYAMIQGRGGEGEMTGPNLLGLAEIYVDPGKKTDIIVIKNDSVNPDIYRYTYTNDTTNIYLYTTHPEKYEFVKCS
jgi:hypothetical protein